MKTHRKQISLPPECRSEQIDEREREHWLDAMAHGNTPENKPKERESDEQMGSADTILHSKEQGKRETDSQ
jgi:hypothetical protein